MEEVRPDHAMRMIRANNVSCYAQGVFLRLVWKIGILHLESQLVHSSCPFEKTFTMRYSEVNWVENSNLHLATVDNVQSKSQVDLFGGISTSESRRKYRHSSTWRTFPLRPLEAPLSPSRKRPRID